MSSPPTGRSAAKSPLPAWREPANQLYLFSLGLLLVLNGLRLFQPWMVADDYRACFFWMGQLHDPEQFRGDLLAAYFRDFMPLPLVQLYAGLTRLMPILLASKLVGILCGAGYFAGAWTLGEALFPDRTRRAFFAAWMAGNGVLIKETLVGISRGFGPGLQFWFLAALVRRKPWQALAAFALAGLFHPISFVSMGAAFGLWWVYEAATRRAELKPHLVVGGGAGVVALGIGLLLTSGSAEKTARYGPVVTQAEVLMLPEWGNHGRWNAQRPRGLATDFGVQATNRINRPTIRPLYGLFCLLVVGTGLLGLARHRRDPLPGLPAVLLFAIGAVIAYQLAYQLAPKLYAPNRYLHAPAPVFAGVVATLGCAGLWRERGRWQRPARWAAAALAGLAFLGGLIVYPPQEHNQSLRPYEAAGEWLRSHSGTNEMFAAFPSNDADTLPVTAQRPVLMNYECDQPMFRRYLEVTRERLRLLFRAYYAFSADDVRELAEGTPTRFLVITKKDLWGPNARRKPHLYPEPHATAIRRWTREHAGMPYYWTTPEAPEPVYEDQTYRIYDLQVFR